MEELSEVVEVAKVTLFLKEIRLIFIVINIHPQSGRMPPRLLRVILV